MEEKDSIKCNSYAACVGIAGDTFLKSQEVVSNLKRFNHISVREEIAQRKLSSVLSDENREGISLDLDPTLLLSGEDWNKVATNVTEEASGRELHKTPVSLERQGLLRLLPEADEISCSQETWPLF